VEGPEIDAYKQRSWNKRHAFQLEVEIRDLPEIFEMEYQSDLWRELGERCLSCGSCSMVCPTCYCYDVADRVELGTRAGSRLRRWDACLFASHALVAGGENFRGPVPAGLSSAFITSNAASSRVRPAQLRRLRAVHRRLPGQYRRRAGSMSAEGEDVAG
jgi:ferredoxin